MLPFGFCVSFSPFASFVPFLSFASILEIVDTYLIGHGYPRPVGGGGGGLMHPSHRHHLLLLLNPDLLIQLVHCIKLLGDKNTNNKQLKLNVEETNIMKREGTLRDRASTTAAQ